jgi:hypothetical protein
MISDVTIETIFSGLRLAQQLLEESDGLTGRNGYDLNGKKWWFHPRHEREALVVYLLLTCFDKLGQRLRIPRQGGHRFHGKLDSDSTASWTPVPGQAGHLK